MKKIFCIITLLAGACSAPAVSAPPLKPEPMTAKIDSYDKCVAAGYPVARSYPAQCRTPDGKVFWGKK